MKNVRIVGALLIGFLWIACNSGKDQATDENKPRPQSMVKEKSIADGKGIGENLDTTGFVSISEKKWNRIKRKNKLKI